MNAKLKMKRIAILDKIDALKNKCSCQNAEQSKECSNCKQIAELGSQLLKLTNPKQVNTLRQHKYPDVRKNSTQWTEEMVDYLLKHVKTHTCKEIGEHLGIEPEKVRNKCKNMKIKYKKENKNNIYQFFDGEKIVAKGTLKEIALSLGLDPSSMQYYRRKTTQDSKKKLVKVEG